MRLAEIVTAGVLALLSIYLMWKSTELERRLYPGRGTGGRRLAVLALGDHAGLHRADRVQLG